MFLIGIDTVPVAIASGTSLSAAVPLGAKTLVGISMPGTWTAAALTFQASFDGTTWQELVDTTGAAVSFTVAAATLIQITPTNWRGTNLIKVRSGTAALAVDQLADRIVTLITRSEMV